MVKTLQDIQIIANKGFLVALYVGAIDGEVVLKVGVESSRGIFALVAFSLC